MPISELKNYIREKGQDVQAHQQAKEEPAAQKLSETAVGPDKIFDF